MNKIHQLPPYIVAKIAAGEVIERPAFAVKELIENAIDAKADDISIFIEQAGLKKIQVIDNGEGMNKEDLLESVKLHTTSKIFLKEDLLGIKTLGFRGEALASLSAVAKVTIKSRIKNAFVGNAIEISNEKIYVSPAGIPEGTTVIAENIFSHIPARKRFLKSPQTEMRHIIDVVSNFVLSYPTIRFSLKHNNKIIFNFSKNQSLEERIRKILGEETFSLLLPVENKETYMHISGFVAKPQLHTSSQNKQYIFVNNRRVLDKLISLAVKESFGTMLESTRYPIFVLFISLPYEMVDINVHPRKEHIAFINQRLVFETTKNTILEVLQKNNITFQNLSWKRSGFGTTNSFAANFLRETILDKNELIIKKETNYLQVHNTYIGVESKHGVVIFDQHAAHERVLFEKLLREFKKKSKMKKFYVLKPPVVLDLSMTEQELFKEHKKTFEKLGFKLYFSNGVSKMNAIEDSTANSSRLATLAQAIRVTRIPFLFQDRNPQEFIKEIIGRLEQGLSVKSIDDVSLEMLSFLACHAAVKAGDKLNKEQMRKIILELEKIPNTATCPHGRPTRIFFDKKELDSMFKR